MANQFRSGMGVASTSADESGPTSYAKPSNLLSLAIFLVPVVFGWLVFWQPYSPTRKVLTGIWMALNLLVIVSIYGPPPSNNPIGSTRSAGSTSATTTLGSWSYYEDRDPMRGTVHPFAVTKSLNEIDLAAPYGGGSTVSLRISKNRKTGSDQVSLYIDKGQFFCNDMEGQQITAKFDDRKLARFSCSTSADGDTQIMFINGERRFIEALRSASRLTLEVPIYDAGNPQFNFDISNLKW